MDDALNDLLLAGYLPLREQGLALPCYLTRLGANRWHVAICSIDGDHAAPVSGFEPYDGTGIRSLPDQALRMVRIGDPWHDVLVWNDVPYVGTPDIVLEQLGDAVDELRTEAPLTLLDLAMAVNAPDRAEICATAFSHLEQRLGREAAERWQADLFVRQQLMLTARRLVLPRTGESRAAIRQLNVRRAGSDLEAVVPAGLATLLEEREAVEAFVERASGVGAVAGINIEIALQDAAIPAVVFADVAPVRERPRLQPLPGYRVLIILSGPRARTVGRFLGTPEWAADWNALAGEAEGDGSRGRALDLDRTWGGVPEVQVVDDQTAMPPLGDFGTVLWVADDEIIARDWGRSVPSELESAISAGANPLCILAPTLPQRHPSELLAEKPGSRDIQPFYTLLDTSTVRSPFWSGNQKRSIARRTADLVLGAAALTLPDSPLRAYLMEDRPRYEPVLLSLSSGIGRGIGAHTALASEVSAAGLKDRRIDEPLARFSWAERPLNKARLSALPVKRGRAEVSRQRPMFRPFATEVVRRSKSLSAMEPDERLVGELPGSITGALRFPDLSAAFRVSTKRRDRPCILTAEAPDLAALRAASDDGWQICRYSDEDTLHDLVSERKSEGWFLPRDIQLPKLNRLGRNKGLAVRGVDPRDVIRFSAEVFAEWRHAASRSALMHDVRWYRSELNLRGEPPEATGVAALSVPAFRDAESRDDVAAEQLRRLDPQSVPGPEALARRTADLRASWEGPVRGVSRYMLEDGRLPVRFGPVDREEVAAQKFFTMDGDGSVPALLMSRIFAVWADATLSRSPSWSSRFSVTRTFETFPIPDMFSVIRDGDAGRASLRLSRVSGALRELVKSLAEDLTRNSLHFPSRQSSQTVPSAFAATMGEIDRLLLRQIDLDKNAADLDILERLVQLNRSA